MERQRRCHSWCFVNLSLHRHTVDGTEINGVVSLLGPASASIAPYTMYPPTPFPTCLKQLVHSLFARRSQQHLPQPLARVAAAACRWCCCCCHCCLVLLQQLLKGYCNVTCRRWLVVGCANEEVSKQKCGVCDTCEI